MKKVLCLILSLVMCLSLCACSSSPQEGDDEGVDEGALVEKESASSFAGLYRNKDGLAYYDNVLIKMQGGFGHYLGVYRYYQLNSDGSGNIYCEVQEDEPLTSIEKEMLAKEKSSFSWKEVDGFLEITYSDGDVCSYEKKGNIFINVMDEEDFFTKVS
jgi:hypothetical protein